MKKILVASVFALSAAVGCTSASDQLCIEQATCAGEDDPAKFCSDAKEDLDEEDRKCFYETCKSQADAASQCTLDNGKCEDEVYTVDPADACESESEAFLDCIGDC